MIFVTLVVLGIILLVFLIVFVPAARIDYDSPLNLVMFQPPGQNRYSDQLVNLWVPKVWRMDDKKIPCRIEHGYSPDVPLSARKLVLYSHGNAEDLMSCTQFLRELSDKVGMDVVTWDYSGYGVNPIDKFERSVEGINLSLKTILDDLLRRGYKLENILFWGYSLGSGPSTLLAAALSKRNEKFLGLILFGAYSSILDVVREKTHPKVAELFTERWNNRDAISDVRAPILLMHGQSDGMIPAKHSETLKQASGDRSKLVLFPNVGHTQFSWNEAMKEVCRWMSDNHIAA